MYNLIQLHNEQKQCYYGWHCFKNTDSWHKRDHNCYKFLVHLCSASNSENMTVTALLCFIENGSCTVIRSIVLLYRSNMCGTVFCSFNGSLPVLLKRQSGMLHAIRFAKVLASFWKTRKCMKGVAVVLGYGLQWVGVCDSIFGVFAIVFLYFIRVFLQFS